MAEEKIQFKIGSQLTGDGFNKADGAIKGIAQTAGKAKGALNMAISEFKAMDSELGKIVGNANSVVQAFASFGIIGASVAAAQVSIGFLTEKIQELGDKCLGTITQLNAITGQFKKISDNAAIKRMDSALKEATVDAQKAMTAIKETADAVNALAGAKGESAVARANERIAALMKEKAEAVAGALNEFEKQVATARGDLKIAQAELEDAHRSAAMQVEKSKRDYATANAKLMQAEDNLASAQYAVAEAEGEYKQAKIHGAVSEQEYKRKLEAARSAEEKATSDVAKAKNELAIAEEKQATAESNMASVINKAEARVITLTAATKEAEEALRKASEATEARGMSEKEYAEFSKKEKERAKAESDAVKKASDRKITAINETITELEKQKTALSDMRAAVNKAEKAYLEHHSWMGKAWEKNANGSIKNFGDFEEYQRWKDRADRDEQANQLYMDRQQAKADDIQRRLDNNRYVSEADKKFLKNWNDYKEQLKGEDDLDTEIRNWKHEQTRIATETKDVLDSIETNLKDALALQ